MPQTQSVIRTWCCSSPLTRTLYVGIAATLVVSAIGQPNPNVWQEPDESLRSRVAEEAFPRVSRGKPQALLILRFTPSFRPEFQITATIERDGTASVEYSAASVSAQEAFRKLSTQQRTPAQVVRLMGVKQTSVSVPADVVAGWFPQFWKTLEMSSRDLAAVALTRRVWLDGTLYSCEYQEGSLRFSLQLPASEVGHESTEDPELVKWMNRIRLDVQERFGSGPLPGR